MPMIEMGRIAESCQNLACYRHGRPNIARDGQRVSIIGQKHCIAAGHVGDVAMERDCLAGPSGAGHQLCQIGIAYRPFRLAQDREFGQSNRGLQPVVWLPMRQRAEIERAPRQAPTTKW